MVQASALLLWCVRGSVTHMETVIIVVLISIIVLGMFGSAWYGMRNLNHYREEVAESDQEWRRHRDGL